MTRIQQKNKDNNNKEKNKTKTITTLEKQNCFKTTLLVESDLKRRHFPFSMSKCIPNEEQKKTEAGMATTS